jgi:hypothetical protein
VVGWKRYSAGNGLNLTIEPGGQGIDPLKLVPGVSRGNAIPVVLSISGKSSNAATIAVQ